MLHIVMYGGTRPIPARNTSHLHWPSSLSWAAQFLAFHLYRSTEEP
jgi:hypothetical protein